MLLKIRQYWEYIWDLTTFITNLQNLEKHVYSWFLKFCHSWLNCTYVLGLMKAALFQPLFSQSWYTTQKLLFSLHHLAKAGYNYPLKSLLLLTFLCCNSSAVRHSFAHNSRYLFLLMQHYQIVAKQFHLEGLIWDTSKEL